MADNEKNEARKVKRMRYFDGLFLRQEEFNLEQEYHIRMRRLHNHNLHTHGIIDGLEVTVNGDQQSVTVAPGMALVKVYDWEHEEEVNQEVILKDPVNLDFLNTNLGNQDCEVYLYLAYTQEKDFIAEECGGKEPIHWWEKPVVDYEKTWSDDPVKLLLAKVSLHYNTEGKRIITAINTDGRVYSGAYGKILLPVEGKNCGLAVEGARVDGQEVIRVKAPAMVINGDLVVGGPEQSNDKVKLYLEHLDSGECNLHVDGSLVINKDLTILGSTTTIQGQTTEIADNILRVNNYNSKKIKEPPEYDSGLEVFRGKLPSAQIVWDERLKQWRIGLEDNLVNLSCLLDQSVVDAHRHNSLYSLKETQKPALSINDDGNIGIGTDAPKQRLHVNGGAIIQGEHGVEIRSNSKLYQSWQLAVTQKGLFHLGKPGLKGAALTIHPDSIEDALVLTAKGIGVGTAKPGETLEVAGTVKAEKFIGDGSLLEGIQSGDGHWAKGAGGIGYLDGNVGIGTENPKAALSINGNFSDLKITFPAITIMNPTGGTGIVQGTNGKNCVSFLWKGRGRSISNTYAAINTSGQPLVLQEGVLGKVGIGTVNPAASLDIGGTFRVNGGTIFSTVQAGSLGASASATPIKSYTLKFKKAFSREPRIIFSARTNNLKGLFNVTCSSVTKDAVIIHLFRVDKKEGWNEIINIDWFAWENLGEKYDGFDNIGIGTIPK
ncbi:MAG: hypothetical protein GXY86_03370 [Firmicutes bacterium]|nr:hypothetical protein [Bacillota bacterium]